MFFQVMNQLGIHAFQHFLQVVHRQKISCTAFSAILAE